MWESDSMARQVIPSRAFRTFSREEDDAGRQSSLTSYQVKGPGGRPRTAQLASVGTGSVLKLQGEISSGLYRLVVPEDQRLFFSHFLAEEGSEIPFTVRRDENESQLEKLSEADYTYCNFVTTQPQPLRSWLDSQREPVRLEPGATRDRRLPLPPLRSLFRAGSPTADGWRRHHDPI